VGNVNSKSTPLVSIVVPAYNEEEHLAECIESILAQTYENWDCTIVNNCSTDKTLEIALWYAAKDPRIRVHGNEQFLDMLPNHNLAVRQISPEAKYCKVVLADDWIFPECLEKMVAVAEAYPSAGVVSSYQLHGQQVRSTGLPYDQTLVSGREVCRQFLMQTLTLFGTQNSVLYRADLVRSRNPFFVESDMLADFEVCLALLQTSDLGFVHQVLTFSRQRARSTGAVTGDLGVNFGCLLGMLFAYGKACLNCREFDECLELHLSQYYEFLGRRLFVEHSPDFWSYHKRTFANKGIGFSRARLAKAALRHLCGRVLDPKSTWESLRRLSLLRKIRNADMRRVASGFESSKVEDGDEPIERS